MESIQWEDEVQSRVYGPVFKIILMKILSPATGRLRVNKKQIQI